MLLNYLRVAWRALARHRAYTVINIAGLGLGMAACLLIVLFVRDEVSYDRHLPEVDRLYRVTYHATNGNAYARIPPPVAPHLTSFFSEVEQAARAFSGNATISVPAQQAGQQDPTFEEEDVFFVDSTFTDLFPRPLVAGTPEDARLDRPFTALVNADVAARYFGDADPIGQTITVNGAYSFTVVGVFEDFPRNTHLHANVLLPYDDMFKVTGEEAEAVMRQNLGINWVISHSYTYVRLQPGADPAAVDRRFPDLVAAQAPEQLQVGQTFSLMPVRDIHLRSDAFLEPEPQGDIRYVYLFSGIALLTLLLPCFNFINLATAQSIGRTREIGVRKAMGAHRGQLFGQFLGESTVITGLAFVVALVLAVLGLPLLNELTGKELAAAALLDPLVLAGFVGVFAATALLGGSYPAWLIARANIVKALRGVGTTAPARGLSLRRVLVALQFGISLTLIAGALVIYQQLDHMLDQPLGYEAEGVVAVPLFSENMNLIFSGVDGEMRSRLNAFEDALAQQPGVLGTTLSRNALGVGGVARGTRPEGHPPDAPPVYVPAMAVDYDFLDVYGLGLAAGRAFDRARGTDHQDAFIVNEAAVRSFGWPDAEGALGKTINLEGKEGRVVGVAKDFNFETLQSAVGPALLEINVPAFRTLSVRIAGTKVSETLEGVEAAWQEFFPERAFDYVFLDETLESQYQNERRFGGVVRAFALLAILISCLGAYGLVLFNVRRRQREIGVRKVLGASPAGLLGLLYRELAALFAFGFVLAVPVVYGLGSQWLDDFAYRITIGPSVFLWSAVVMLGLATLTISYQALRAARLNPVDCLRDE